jgi:pimeloyl-ACP methyl ester carboxylesterase
MTSVASTDGVELAVHHLRTAGRAGEGPPVLLAHANGFHGLVWRPLAVRLAGGPAVALDFRGHGASRAPEPPDFVWDGFADDVLAVVDALGLRRPFGVGHSMGGAALLLAEQRRPGTFCGLYLFEPVVFPGERLTTPVESALSQGALRRRDRFASRPEAYERFAAKPPLDAFDPEALWAYVEHGFVDEPDGGVRLACRPEHEAQIYRMGSTHGAFEHLERVSCPVTVATGAVTSFGPAAFAEHIAAGLPRGRILSSPTLGHFGPLEAPARIAAEIDEAISRAG